MDISDRAARPLAMVSGIVGVIAAAFLLGFFTLGPGVRLAGLSLGTINDGLGAIQFATLAPVAWAVGRRLPPTRTVRAATGVAVVAMITFALLSVLLVVEVLTFAAQIGPLMAAILAIYGWLLLVNLVAHRTRRLPRLVSGVGVLTGIGLLTGMVLVGVGLVLPGIVGQLVSWPGYGLGSLAWLGLPVYVLLLAARVFSRSPSPAVATPTEPLSGVRS